MRLHIKKIIISILLVSGYSGYGQAINSSANISTEKQDLKIADITNITSETLIVDINSSATVFMKDVTVSSSQYSLKCDTLRVFSNKENKMEAMEAEGNVLIKTSDGEARGSKLSYSILTGEFILENGAVLKQAGSEMSADKMTVMIKDRKISGVRCEGNVKGFVPSR